MTPRKPPFRRAAVPSLRRSPSVSRRSDLSTRRWHGQPTAVSWALASMVCASVGLFGVSALLSAAKANPRGPTVVNGNATFTNEGNKLIIRNTDGTVINWQSFNIAPGEQTHFQQTNASSTVINRVVGNDPSKILGLLTSNGRVVLVNPFGITVGRGASVDTAGFTASALNLSEADAKAGRMRFQGNALNGSAGAIQVDGVVRTQNGDIFLFAPSITVGVDGLVRAENGNVILGAGQKLEVTGRGLEGIKFEIQGAADKVTNLGQLQGNAVGVFAGAIKHSGVIIAQTASLEGGKVVLRAVKDIELTAASKIIADGSIKPLANPQNVSQNTPQTGGAGGHISVTSVEGNVSVGAGAVLSAKGANAPGGQIVMQAEQGHVTVQPFASLNADGLSGGSVRVESASISTVAGVLSARGVADWTGVAGFAAGTGLSPMAQTGASGEVGASVGGQIDVLGRAVSIDSGAVLDVSGDHGGGKIRVGGDLQGRNAAIQNAQQTNVSANVLLLANAKIKGNGGQVIVWSDDTTRFGGVIQAQGGEFGGDGGFGETSGHQTLYFRGRADMSARRGRMGSLLLDPADATIAGGANMGAANTFYEDDIEASAAGFTLSASNGITSQAASAFAGGFISLATAGAGFSLEVQTGGTGGISLQPGVSTNGGAISIVNNGLGGVVSVHNLRTSPTALSGGAAIQVTNMGGSVVMNGVNVAGAALFGVTSTDGFILAAGGTLSAGTMNISANRVNWAATGASLVVGDASAINVRPFTTTRPTILGGDDASPGTFLGIDSTEFSRVMLGTNSVFRIGDTTSYDGTISVAPTGVNFIYRNTALLTTNAGAITDGGALTNVAYLRAQSGIVDLGNHNHAILFISGQAGSGGFSVRSASDLGVADFDSAAGIRSASSLTLAGTETNRLTFQHNGNLSAEGNINISAFGSALVQGGNYVINSNFDGVGSAGDITFGAGITVAASTTGRGLTLAAGASDFGATGGDIILPNFDNGGTLSLLNTLYVNTRAPTYPDTGNISLHNTSVSLASSGSANFEGRVVVDGSNNLIGGNYFGFVGEIQAANTISPGSLNIATQAATGVVNLYSVVGTGNRLGQLTIAANTEVFTNSTVQTVGDLVLNSPGRVSIHGASLASQTGTISLNTPVVRASLNNHFVGAVQSTGSLSIQTGTSTQRFSGPSSFTALTLPTGNSFLDVDAGKTLSFATLALAGVQSLTLEGPGTVVAAGTVSVNSGANLVMSNAAGVLRVAGGDLAVSGGAFLRARGSIALDAGHTLVLSGSNLGVGDFGVVGTLNVTGDVRLENGSYLNVDWSSGGVGDRLNVSGNFATAGATSTLEVSERGGVHLVSGATLSPVSFGSYTGTLGFSSSGADVNTVLGHYKPVLLSLQVSSVTTKWQSPGGGDWHVPANWTRGVPTGSDHALIDVSDATPTVTVGAGNFATAASISFGAGGDHLRIDQGTLTLNGAMTVPTGSTLTLLGSSGVIDGSASMTIAGGGEFVWQGGSLTSGVSLRTDPGSTTQVTAGFLGGQWENCSDVSLITGGLFQIQSGGSLHNSASGFFNFGAGNHTLAVGSGASILNLGTMGSGTAASTLSISGAGTFENQGTVAVSGGARVLIGSSGSAIDDVGQYDTGSTGQGINFLSGNRTLGASSNVVGTGTLVVQSGAVLKVKGALAVAQSGHVRLDGGTLNLSTEGTVTFNNPLVMGGANAVILGFDDLQLNAGLSAASATLAGSGTLFTQGQSGITGHTVVERNWVNAGTLNLNHTSSELSVIGVLTNQGVLNVNTGVSTPVYVSGGSLMNQGVVNWSVSGRTLGGDSGGQFSNNGTVNFSGSMVTVNVPVFRNTGAIKLFNNATLQRSAGILNEGTIFGPGGSSATLALGTGTLNFSAGGTLTPAQFGMGTIAIQGNLDLGPGLIDLNFGPGSQSAVTVTGNGSFDSSVGSRIRVTEPVPFIGSDDLFSAVTVGGILTGTVDVISNVAGVSFGSFLSTGIVKVTPTQVSNNWVASGSGNWSAPTNWSRGHAPRAGEDATLAPIGAQTISVDGPGSAALSLTMVDTDDRLALVSGGTLSLSQGSVVGGTVSVGGGSELNVTGLGNSLTVGTLSLAGGRVAGTGLVQVSNHLNFSEGALAISLNLSGTGLMAGGTSSPVIDGAVLTVNPSGTLSIGAAHNADALLKLNNSGSLVNAGRVQFDTTNVGSFGIGGDLSGQFINVGTLNVNLPAGQEAQFGVAYIQDSNALMSVQTGTLSLWHGAVWNGSTQVSISAGSKLALGEGAGVLDVQGATFVGTGELDIGQNATIRNTSANWVNTGLLTGAGTLDLGGGFTLSNAATGTISPGGAGFMNTLTVLGRADLGAGTLRIDLSTPTHYDVLAVSQSVNIGPGLAIDRHDVAATYSAGANFDVVVSGVGAMTGTAPTLGGFNTAIISTPVSALRLSPVAGDNFWNLQSGTVFVSGNWNVGANWSQGFVPTAAQQVIINRPDPLTVVVGTAGNVAGGVILGANNTLSVIAGGSLALDGTKPTQLSGLLNVNAGSLTMLGSPTLSGGSVQLLGGGFLGVGGSLALGGSHQITDSRLVVGAALNQTGSINFSGNSTVTAATWVSTGSVLLGDNATLNIGGATTLTNQGLTRLNATIGTLADAQITGRFDNVGGTLVVHGAGVLGSGTDAGHVQATGPSAYLSYDNAQRTVAAGATYAMNTLKLSNGTTLSLAAPLLGAGIGVFDIAGNSEVAGPHNVTLSNIGAFSGRFSGAGTLFSGGAVSGQGAGTLSMTGLRQWVIGSGEHTLSGSLSVISLASGSTLTVASGALLNVNNGLPGVGTGVTGAGELNLFGTLSVAANRAATLSVVNLKQAGILDLSANAQLSVVGSLINEGIVRGNGTISAGSFTNAASGTINPGGMGAIGTLSLIGGPVSLTQGTLNTELFSTLSYDVLRVGGAGTLAAGLVVNRIDTGATYAAGAEFSIIDGATLSGGLPVVGGFTSALFGGPPNAFRITALGGDNHWNLLSGTTYISGAWNVGTNWSQGYVPTAAQQVHINRPDALTVSISTGGNLAGGVILGVNNTLAVGSGGSLAIDGTKTTQLGGRLSVDGGSVSIVGSPTVSGVIQLANAGFLGVDGALALAGSHQIGSGRLVVGGTLNQTGSITFDGTSTVTAAGWTNSGSVLLNDNATLALGGVTTLSNAGTTRLNATVGAIQDAQIVGNFNNVGGTLIVNGAGMLGSGIDAGHMQVSGSGAYLVLNNAQRTVAPGASFTVNALALNGASTLTLATDLVGVSRLELLGGSEVTGPHNVTLSTFNALDGRVSGAGTLITGSGHQGGGMLSISGGRQWIINGAGGDHYFIAPNSAVDLAAGSTLTVNSSAALNFSSGSLGAGAGVRGAGELQLLGSLKTSPGINASLSVASFRQAGLIDVAGTATLIRAGTLLNEGTISGIGTLSVTQLINATTGAISPWGTGLAGTLTIAGDLDLRQGKVNIELTSTTNHDVLRATGFVTLGAGTVINRTDLFATYAPGATFDVIRSGDGALIGAVPTTGGFSNSLVSSPAFALRLTAAGGNNLWLLPSSGAWEVGGNWSVGAAPTAAQQVIINQPSALTVTVSAPGQVAGGVVLGANNTLSIGANGRLAIDGAKPTTISGHLIVDSAGEINFANSQVLAGTLTLANSARLISSGSLSLSGVVSIDQATISTSGGLVTSGIVNLAQGLQITGGGGWNNAGNVFVAPGSSLSIAGGVEVNNSGLLSFLPSAVSGTNWQNALINNTGTISATGLAGVQIGRGTDSGQWTVGTGANLLVSSDRTLNPGFNATGSGTIAVSLGTLALNTLVSLGAGGPSLVLFHGTLSGAHAVQIGSNLYIQEGSALTGGVHLQTRTGSSVRFATGGGSTLDLSGGANWSNGGLIDIDANGNGVRANVGSIMANVTGGEIRVGSGRQFSLIGAGAIGNAGGLFSVGAGATLAHTSASSSQQGVVDLAGGGVYSGNNLLNEGTIRGHGSLQFAGVSNAATGVLSPGGAGNVGTLSIAGSADLSFGTVNIELTNGSSHDALIASGLVTLGAGTVINRSDLFANYAPGASFDVIRSGSGAIVGTAPTAGGFTNALVSTPAFALRMTALGGDNVWLLPVSGAWESGGNWSVGAAPTAAQQVVINHPSALTVTVSTPGQVAGGVVLGASNTLAMGAGGNLTLDGSKTNGLAGTVLIDGGQLILPAGVSIPGTVLLVSGSFSTPGALTLNGSLSIGAGTSLGIGGGLTTNGLVTVAGLANVITPVWTQTGTLQGSGTVNLGGGTFVNQGLLSPGGSGVLGTLTVLGNAQLLSGSTYQVDVGSQDQLIVSGNLDLSPGATISVSELTANAVKTNGRYDIVVAGTLSGGLPTLSSNISGVSRFIGTVSSGQSTLQIAPAGVTTNWQTDSNGAWTNAALWSRGTPMGDSTAIIDRATANPVVTVSGNAQVGQLSVRGGDALAIGSGASLGMAQRSDINNLQLSGTLGGAPVSAGGVVILQAGAVLGTVLATSGTLGVSGALTVTGGVSANAGVVDLGNSQVVLSGGNFDLNGANANSAGATLIANAGTFSVGGASQVSGTVNVSVSGAGALLVNTGAGLNVAQITQTGGSIGGSGDIRVSGAYNVSGGDQHGSGTTRLQSAGANAITGGTLNRNVIVEPNAALNMSGTVGGGALLDNRGSLATSNLNSGLALVNSGAFSVNAGEVRFNGGVDLNSGQVSLSNSALLGGASGVNLGASVQLNLGQTGTLDGGVSGVIIGGNVNPGGSGVVGELVVLGNLTLLPSAVLGIDLNSVSSFDRLVVSGQAAVGGRMQIADLGGASYSAGAAFNVVSAGSGVNGSFVSLSPGASFTGASLGNNYRLQAVAADNGWTGAAGDNNWFNPGNWASGHVPMAAEKAIIDQGGAHAVNLGSGPGFAGGIVLGADDRLNINSQTLTIGGEHDSRVDGTISVGGSGAIVWAGGVGSGGGAIEMNSGSVVFANGRHSIGAVRGDGLLNILGGTHNVGSARVGSLSMLDGRFAVGDLAVMTSLQQSAGVLDVGSLTAVQRGGLLRLGNISVRTSADLVADELSISGTLTSPLVRIRTATIGRGVVLGSSVAGALSIDEASLGRIQSPVLSIGSISGGGDVSMTGAVNRGAGALLIGSAGTVSQSGAGVLTVATFAVSANAVLLDTLVNDFGVVAGVATGALALNDRNGVTVGSVGVIGQSLTGLTSGGEMRLTSAGAVAQNAHLIAGGGLRLSGAGGFGLGFGGNRVNGAVVLNGVGAITLSNSTDLDISGSSAGALALNATGNVNLGSLSVGGPLTIDATARIGQSAAITVAGLTSFNANDINLGLASSYGGPVRISAVGAATLSSSGPLAFQARASSVVLRSTGSVTQSGAIEASSLNVTATGQTVNLTDAGNTFSALSFNAANLSARSNASTLQVSGAASNSTELSFAGTLGQNGAFSSRQLVLRNLAPTGSVLLNDVNVGTVSFSGGGAYTNINYRTAASNAAVAGVVSALGVVNLSASNSGLDMPSINAGTVAVNAAGALTQQAGATLAAGSVQLQGASIGTTAQAIDLTGTARAQLVATAGGVNARSGNALTLIGSNAATSSFRAVGNGLAVTDARVTAPTVFLDAGTAELAFVSQNGSVLVSAGNATVQGGQIRLQGGANTNQSVDVNASGAITATTAGNFVVNGGAGGGAHAALTSDGPLTIAVGGVLSLTGGSGSNAYAKLDPIDRQPLEVTAQSVSLTGGSGNSAYAAITSEGNVSVNSANVSLSAGVGANADAVIVSYFGKVVAPGCAGCVQLTSSPLANLSTQTGILQGPEFLTQLLQQITNPNNLAAIAQIVSRTGQTEGGNGNPGNETGKRDKDGNLIVDDVETCP